MKFCPNFSIPSVRTEFTSLSSVVGEDFAYFVWNKNQGKSIDNDNPLYDKLLSEYGGNRDKAILASSIIYSYQFKRRFPDFNKSSVGVQAKNIQEFFSTSKKGLEETARKTINAVSRVHRAETVRGVELFIDRRQAEQVKEEVEEVTEAVSDKPSSRDLLDAYHRFKQSPLSENVSFVNLHRVVNGGAFAQWTKGAMVMHQGSKLYEGSKITLFNGADFTDLYHESWHEFTQGYFNLAEKTAIWAEIKNRLGNVNIGGKEVPYYSLTNRQADEILAEEYRTYSMQRSRDEREFKPQAQEEEKSFLERVFDRIYNFLQSLFGDKQIDRENPLQVDTIQQLFSDLYEGKIDVTKYNPSNITETSLNKSKELDLSIVSDEGEVLSATISSMEMAEVFGGIDYFFTQAMNKRGLTYAFLGNDKLKQEFLPKLYNDVKVYFETYYNQLLDEEENANEADAAQLEDRINTLNWVLSSDASTDNWEKIVKHHKSFSKGGVLEDKSTQKENSQEQDTLERDDESVATRDLKINKDEGKIDTELLMFPTVLELVKNLPNVVVVNGIPQPVYSRFLGLPTTSDYVKNKNLLLNRLSGVRSYAEVLNIIKQSTEVSPQLAYLLDQLPPSEGVLTREQYTLKQQFIQSFTLPTTVPFSVKLQEDLENSTDKKPMLKTTTYQENTLSVDSLIEQFDQDFSDNSDRMFRNVDEQGLRAPIFNVQAALAHLASQKSEVANDRQMFDFYKSVFGVDLLKFETPDALFNREGNVIPGISSVYTPSNMKALRGVASHAFRKMRLFLNVAKSEDLPSYVKALVSIDNISNPMAYFTTDISTKLAKAIESLPNDNVVKKSFKKDFPFRSIQNQRRTAFNTIELTYNISNSGSFLTVAKTMEYSIGEWNALHSVAEKLNSVENISELQGHINLESNKFMQYSAWMNKMFAEDGSRNTNLAGEAVELEVLNFSGFQAGIDGQKTTSLTADDKFLQDFLSFLHSGVFENIRFGGKSFAYASVLKGNQREKNYYDKEQFDDAIENGKIVGDGFSTQMQKYLYFEAMRVFEGMNGKQNKKNKRASEFILFHDILDKDTKDALRTIIKNSKNVNEVPKNIRAFFKADGGKFRFTFEKQLNDWFSGEVNNHVSIINNILADGDTKKLPTLFGQIVPSKTPYTIKNIQAITAYYLANYFTHQVEVLHIMVSDQSNFNYKGSPANVKEIFKRLGPSATPGRQPIIDAQDVLTLNSDKNSNRKRLLEKEVTGNPRDYDSNYNYVVFNDIPHFDSDKFERDVLKNSIIQNYATWLASTKNRKKANAKDIEEATKLLGNSLDATYDQKEESNAQAHSTLDFARHYLDTIGEWGADQEEAYMHEVEVFKAIKEYRKNESPENLFKVKSLIEQSNKGIFVSLKLGHHSNTIDHPSYVTLGKFSVLPLIPSAVFNTDLEDRMVDMLSQGVDLSTFESGNKMAHPVDYVDFYEEGFDSKKIKPIPQEAVVRLPISGLRRQQYIAPKFKNSATLSSQLVKLMFANFYENGEFSERLASVPGLKERIDAAQEAFIKNLEMIVEAEKAKIFLNIGATVNSKTGELESVDAEKYKKWLLREFDKKDVSPVIYDYLSTNNNNEFTLSLDASPQRSVIEGTITAAINKRVIKPKLFGEAYVQSASSGFQMKGKRFNKLNKNNIDATIKKYGLTGVLRDYRVENGKSQPADIALSFNPVKHGPLLKLEYKGVKIEDTALPFDTLNQALMDDAWVEQHSDKITLVGVRIPTQKINSFEHFRIRRFLPTSQGPVIVVPPSIVTKSGSDFDIDKLFMYEPELDPNTGEFNLWENAVINGAKKNELIQLMANRLQLLSEKKELKALLTGENVNFILFQNKLLGKDAKILRETIESFKQLLKDVSSDKENLSQEIQELKFKLSVVRNIREKYRRENPKLFDIVDTISALNDILKDFELYTPQNVKRIASNNFVKIFSNVLSEPALFPALIEPNESPVLRKLADEYNKLRSSKNNITGTSMFLPRISNIVYSSNTLAAKSLGTDAKVNALHKLYQQTGLVITEPSLTKFYRIKSNKTKDGYIILGGYKDADSDKLISDIINEFINGHVDVEKEDWINYFNADPDRTAIILQMILNGTPIEDALMLVNQPIIQHFISTNRTSKIRTALKIPKISLADYYKEMLTPLGKKPVYDGPIFNEMATIEMLLEDSLIRDQITKFNELDKTDLSNDIAPVSVEVSKSKFNALKEAVFRGDLTQVSSMAMQVALFTQFRVTNLQNEKLLNLTRAIDFNTSSYRNVQDFYSVAKAIQEAKETFNEEAIDKIINASVVSPFNVTKDVLTLFNNTFDIIANPVIQDMVSLFQETYGRYWSRERKVLEANNLVSAITHGLVQKYGLDGTTDFYQKYGPKSDNLTTKKEGNLLNRFQALKNIEDHIVKRFLGKNLFFQDLSHQIIPNSGLTYKLQDGSNEKVTYDKFIFRSNSNDKHSDTIATFQAQFIQALNFAESTPENNQLVTSFFRDLAYSTIGGQGFTIKYRSIHPYIPVAALPIAGAVYKIKEFKKLYSKSELTEAEKDELQAFQEFLADIINEVSIPFDKLRRKQYTPYKRYFPDFVKEKKFKKDGEVVGIEISSNVKGLGAALTNPTEASRLKENITKEVNILKEFGKRYKKMYRYGKGLVSAVNITKDTIASYPIIYKGKLYADVEAAYQANKNPYLITKTTQNLMKELVKIKLESYPDLVKKINDLGGVELLEKSTHNVKGDKFWESKGDNMFVKVLTEAYQEVIEEDPTILEENPEVISTSDYEPSYDVDPETGIFYEIEPPEITSMSRESLPLKKKATPKEETVLIKGVSYTKDDARLLTLVDLTDMGLDPQEINDLLKQLC